MLTLAVTTDAETFERIQQPLLDRDISAIHFPCDERVLPVTTTLRDVPSFDVGLVYPSRLMEGAVVSAHLAIPWVNDRTAVLTSRNKAGVLAQLATRGVPVPETAMVSNPVSQPELARIFDSFDPPVVVKPNSATRGVGVVKVHDRDSFLGITDYFDAIHRFEPTGDRSFLVQEYLDVTHDYRVMVLDGEYAGAVERRVPADGGTGDRWIHNVHRSAEATGVSLSGDLRELAERTAHILDIPLLGVDLLVTDDRAVVTEVNARPTIDDTAKYEPGFYDALAELIRTAHASEQ